MTSLVEPLNRLVVSANGDDDVDTRVTERPTNSSRTLLPGPNVISTTASATSVARRPLAVARSNKNTAVTTTPA